MSQNDVKDMQASGESHHMSIALVIGATIGLIGLIILSNLYGTTTTRYISLFPMVILTGMVERFWTLETEDSTTASFKTRWRARRTLESRCAWRITPPPRIIRRGESVTVQAWVRVQA